MIADTGTTGHFCEENSNVINIKHSSGISAIQPDGAPIKSTKIASLGLPELPAAASEAHLFPTLAPGSLISIGQLTDHGCEAHFDKTSMQEVYNRKILLNGVINETTKGLWEMKMPQRNNPPTADHAINVIMKLPSIADRVDFYRACMISPAILTLCKAINVDHLLYFPGHLTSK